MRQQNFHKKAHTASFLQTFHSGISSTGRDYRAEMAANQEPESDGYGHKVGEVTAFAEYAPPAGEEAKAVEFVTGRKSAKFADFTTDRSYVAEYSGIKVKHGEGLITEPQAKYVVSIALEREGVTEAMLESLKARLIQGFAKNAASQFISTYKGLPRKAPVSFVPAGETPERLAVSPVAADVADGRYAVEHEGTLKFFKVKNGRRPGFVFLDVQASDEWHSIRNVSRIKEILALIAADGDAAARYGRELGKCYRCGRTLTDATSRSLGIGPDCRAK